MIILLNTKRRLCLRKEALGSSKLPKLTWHNTCFIYVICWQLRGLITPLFSLDSESTKTPMSLGVRDQDTGFIIMAVGDWRCDVDPKSKWASVLSPAELNSWTSCRQSSRKQVFPGDVRPALWELPQGKNRTGEGNRCSLQTPTAPRIAWVKMWQDLGEQQALSC